ncbi:hypothetical protein JDV02_004766 [Purpureocillium takamizusanense]|uniref:Uncharacterized protein n=1 Tax=Purpureocillium takamizusanense TaxID=2060973 RepID=A0A9Q8VB41_9HYPO|nr:uncharacterized protein JDV02_004766 [Purpureocillium takamizusanense]UNI18499.1 hypothetical protein JDV02_004766 [Purpureocillium takamizusanense]
MPFPRAFSGSLPRAAAAGRRTTAPPGGRPVLSPATAAPTGPHPHQAQQVRGVKDDLGGPGGQQPPPQKPSGTDALRRNWVPFGGAALLLLGAYAYLTGGGPTDKPSGMPALPPETETAVGVGGVGGVGREVSPAAVEEAAGRLAKRLEDKESATLARLSGRRKSEFGSFRSE